MFSDLPKLKVLSPSVSIIEHSSTSVWKTALQHFGVQQVLDFIKVFVLVFGFTKDESAKATIINPSAVIIINFWKYKILGPFGARQVCDFISFCCLIFLVSDLPKIGVPQSILEYSLLIINLVGILIKFHGCFQIYQGWKCQVSHNPSQTTHH